MSYATVEELKGQGIPAAAVEELTDTQLQAFLDGATSLVDSYLRGRYTLPTVAPFPAELRRAVVVVASYDLLAWRGYDMRQQGGDETFLKRYEQVIEWLERVRSGEVVVALPASTSTTVVGGGFVASRELRGW